MTKISAFFQLPADIGKRDVHTVKNDLDSQHENWLRQMELSMLSDLNQHGSFNASPIQAQKPGMKPESNYVKPLSEQAYTQEKAALTKREIYPVTPQVAKSGNVVNDSTQGNDPQAVEQKQVGGNHQGTSAQAVSTASEATMDVIAAGAEAGSKLDLMPGKYDISQAGSSAISQPMLSTGSAAAQALKNSSLPGKNNSVDVISVQPISPRTSQFSRDISRASHLDQSESQGEDLDVAEEEMGHVAEPAQDKQVWQKRMMHVTTDDQNVNVWIRDQDISAEQTPLLIKQLTSEMAESGLRLNGATINGELVFKYKDVDTEDEASLSKSDDFAQSLDDKDTRDISINSLEKAH
ncbi:hypothetical protein ACO0LM_02315 [Undibacterium sp. Di26W]|uniref:hypothetical protein n=1 Tax=Undibacterium sp. Di26W TaxID=3413035 RepID=UPI003BF42C5A